MRRLRRAGIAALAISALSFVCLGETSPAASASQSQPKVTNGGYMQAQLRDGKSAVLPLRHTDVDAKISGVVASVRVTQQFHNPHRQAIEAIYVFPLPHRAAIHSMRIKIGKRSIRGVIKRRSEAKRIYRRARAQGRTAALLEQERPNIFTQSVANILPGETIEVSLRYVETLTPEAGRYAFVFPMVVGPRYVGGRLPLGTSRGKGWARDSVRVPDASRITPRLLKKGLRPGHDIALKLHIEGGVVVRDLRVVAHRAQLTQSGTSATVVLDKRDSIPNRDFVVRYRLAGQRPQAALLAQRDKRGGHLLLMVQPKAKMRRDEIAPREIVFVVDNSGSMAGFPLSQARALVERSLRNLRPTDTFQIIKFAGRPDRFAATSVPATKALVSRGVAFVGQMRGGGGTEFLPALRMVLSSAKSPSRARTIVFITDGYIGYEHQVLRYLRQHAKGNNIFALGVGSSVNRFLIDGMARIGGGAPFYLLNTEKARKVVARLFATISRPALTNIEIDWGGLDVAQQTPAAIPDLFGERPVMVAARFGKGGRRTITIKGQLAGQAFRQQLQVKLPSKATTSHAAIATLWARRRIADLMDLHATEPAQRESAKESVTKLGLRYQLMSRFTSFVAVDSRVRNRSGRSVAVPVPLPLPQGVTPAAAPARAYRRHPAPRRYKRRAGKRDELDDLIDGAIAGRARPSRRRSARAATPATATKPTRVTRRALQVRLRGDLALHQGPLTARVARHLMRRMLPAIKAELRRRGITVKGWLRLRVEIDAKGRVQRVVFVSGSAMRSDVARAVRKVFRGVRVPAALSGRFSATLLFQ